MVALLDDNGSGTVTPRLVRYINGDKQASLAAGSTFNLTDTTTYTVKAVINDDPGNAALQELNLYVGGTLRLTTTAIDASWPAGLVGLFRTTNTVTTTLQWDDFICGLDKDVDGTIGTVGSPDSGDWIFAEYNFNDPGGGDTWQKLTLSYDNNGNVTNDGLLESAYDAWNRCVRRGHNECDITDPNQATMKYSYLGDGRSVTKVFQNRGTEIVANDGGNLSLVYLRDHMARSSEERNGSNQAVRQFINGLDYGPCFAMDVNGDPAASNDANIDNNDGSEGSESPIDKRYFVHMTVAMTCPRFMYQSL